MADNREQGAVNRRDFLAASLTSAAALTMLGAEEIRAQETKPAAQTPTPAPVNCAVIGLGPQGREIVSKLSRLPGANIVAICDIYTPYLNRVKNQQAKAAVPTTEARQIFDRKDIAAVFIATPTHQHKDLVLQALQAGKHVYCEAPIAHTVEDARAIAAAAKAASKQVFQAGLQYRANPQHQHVNKFVRGGIALGKEISARAQWNRKESWRRSASDPKQEQAINWRLRRATSPGLVGEVGIHSIDAVQWFTSKLPVAVTGFGSIMLYNDGREVPDTVECVLEYPGGFRMVYSATLANTFDKSYELVQGKDATVLIREQRAWLFKEVDAPLLGWEVYARQEDYGVGRGIVLVADATKIIKLGLKPGEAGTQLDPGKDALYYSVEAFLDSIRENKPSVCGPVDALQATVTALKANEAVMSGTRVTFQKEWFAI